MQYEQGRTKPRDFAEAVSWYRKAAEQGLPEAQYRLGLLLAAGNGAARDEHAAYVWFSLASDEVHDAEKERDRIAQTMTPTQLKWASARTAMRRINNPILSYIRDCWNIL